MAAAVPLRRDFDAEALRALAKSSRDPAQTRRLLARSAIDAGHSRTEAAQIGGVGLQTVRDWVVAFNAQGPDGLIDRKAPGARPRLNADQREALRALIEQGPVPAAHGVVRWRLADLAQILFEDHGVSISEPTLSRVLRAMGYPKLSARPRHHAQASGAAVAFKKPSPPAWRRSHRPQVASRAVEASNPGAPRPFMAVAIFADKTLDAAPPTVLDLNVTLMPSRASADRGRVYRELVSSSGSTLGTSCSTPELIVDW